MDNKKVYAILDDFAEMKNQFLLTFENMEEYEIFKRVLESKETIVNAYGGHPELGDPKHSIKDILPDIYEDDDDCNCRYRNKEFFEKYDL